MRRCPAAGYWQPAERHRKHDGQQGSQPERRHRDPQQGDRRRDMIDGRPRSRGCQNPERNRNQDRDGHRGRGEFGRRRHPLRDRGGHRLIRPNRRAKVAAHDAGHEAGVLHVKRTIQAEALSKCVDVLRRRAVSQHRLHGIAGNQVNEQKDERGHANQDGNGERQPAKDETKHVRFPRAMARCPGEPSAWSTPGA